MNQPRSIPMAAAEIRLTRKLKALARALQELASYLQYLRVPLLLLLIAVVAFFTEQVSDVLLAMALEPEWGEFGLAAAAAGLFGVTLWFSARSLSDLRWMRPRPAARQSGEPQREARPRVRSMPAWVVWWLPRILGMAPPLLMAVAMLWGVGRLGVAGPMAGLLLLEAMALLVLLYMRTRLPDALGIEARGPLSRILVDAITIRSGNRYGLFTPRTELVLMALAWMILAVISIPIARAAYGPFGGGSPHLYAVLLGGAAVLALDRLSSPEATPRNYWLSFVLLLLLALLVPLLLHASGISGVAMPRWLGSIAILYASLTIFLVFASSFFAFGTKTGLPLLSLLLLAALVLGIFRVNDNHAVRLLAPEGTPALPGIEASVSSWLEQGNRRAAISERSGDNKWPIYVVSAQGGGVYAAYHAAKALAVLSREIPEFPQHLFAISGVSGGSVGAALYANALNPAGDNGAIVERIDAMFDHDHLAPVLAAMLFPDTTQRFYPWPVPAWDRALGLELSFSDGGDAKAPVSLDSSFYADRREPLLVLNTTEVNSGRRFLLSQFRFPSDATFHEPIRSADEALLHQDVRLSTAAVMSARFPLITPYAFFNGTTAQRELRSVDGGYYDNSGAVTAQEIAQALQKQLAKEGLNQKVEVIPIAIVNRSSFPPVKGSDRQIATSTSTQKPLLNISALEALFATREARVAKTVSDFGVHCGSGEDSGVCITLSPKYRINSEAGKPQSVRSIPLGWTLSCQARAFISSQLNPDPAQSASDLACLRRQNQTLQLEAAEPLPASFPSFAKVVTEVRQRVAPSPSSRSIPSTTTSATN